MLEFVFFDPRPRQRFVDCLRARDVAVEELVEADVDAGEGQAAGVVVKLASGDTVYARVDPRLLGRIMEVLTPQELGEVVNAIVDAVENPDGRPLCDQPNATD